MDKQIRIVLTGVESSGKTTLAQELAAYFNVPLVEEYAREFLVEKKRNYVQADLLQIAKGQLNHINSVTQKLFICDTDLQVIKIWSLVKYKTIDEFILQQYQNNFASLYILCDPDFPWEFDVLRENKFDRNEIHQLYLNELKKHNLNYIVANGTIDDRKKYCIKSIIEQFSTYL